MGFEIKQLRCFGCGKVVGKYSGELSEQKKKNVFCGKIREEDSCAHQWWNRKTEEEKTLYEETRRADAKEMVSLLKQQGYDVKKREEKDGDD